jgi:hypothetical protein
MITVFQYVKDRRHPEITVRSTLLPDAGRSYTTERVAKMYKINCILIRSVFLKITESNLFVNILLVFYFAHGI